MKFNNSIYFTLILLLLAFTSCIKDDSFVIEDDNNKVLSEKNFEFFLTEVQAEFYNNSEFIDEFILNYKMGSLNKGHYERLLSILNISQDMDLSRLHYLNKKNRVYEAMDRRSLQYFNNFPETEYRAEDPCDRLVMIRDAMLEECDKYILGIDVACKGAVMIAFWYHWNDKDCGD